MSVKVIVAHKSDSSIQMGGWGCRPQPLSLLALRWLACASAPAANSSLWASLQPSQHGVNGNKDGSTSVTCLLRTLTRRLGHPIQAIPMPPPTCMRLPLAASSHAWRPSGCKAL